MAGQAQFGIQGSFNVAPITQGAAQVNAALAGITRQAARTTQQVGQTTQQVNQLNRQSQQLGVNLGRAFSQPAQNLIFLGLDLQQLGRSMAVVGGAAVAAGAASGKFAIDFGNALARVNALAQLSDEQILRVGNRIRDLATDPQVLQGPTELANSLQFLVSSGFTTANAFGVLRTASIGATAGQAELETVTRALASTMNALPAGTITAQSALDVMFETVDKGIITFDELTSTMGETLGAVGATGISFEEFGAAVSVITRAGIPASETMTSLNRVLLSFVAPTTEAREAAADLGIEFNLQALRSKGLAVALDEITRAAGGNTETLDKLFGDVRALRGVLALTGDGIGEFNQLLESQQRATEGLGAANAALEKQLEKPGAALQLLKRDVEAAGITIGEDFLPLVLDITRVLRDAVVGFSELDDSVKRSVFIIGGIFAALGGFAFVAGTVFTAAGAIQNFGNFLRSLGLFATGASGSLANTTRTMQQQGVAANTAALANQNLARSLAAVTLASRAGAVGLVLPTGAQTTANAAAIAAASQGAQQLGANSAAAALSFGRLAALVGQASIWLTLAAVVGGAANSLLDFAINAQVASRDTEELGRRIDDLANRKPLSLTDVLRNAGQPGGVGQLFANEILRTKELKASLDELGEIETRPEFIQRFAQQLGVGLEKAEEIAKRQVDVAESAARQAADAQLDAIREAQEKFPQAVANFQKAIASAGDDPQLQARLEASLNRLLVEGPNALVESGFLQLSPAQKAAIVNRLNFREEAAQRLEAQGNQAGADFLRGLNDELQRSTGFALNVPVDIETDFAPAIREAENRLAQVRQNLADALKPEEDALKALEKAQKAARIEQLQLNLVMQDAQRAFRVAQDAVNAVEEEIKQLEQTISDLEDQFQAAVGRLSNLGQTQEIGVKVVLQGLPEIEDQIFGIGQEIANLQLQLLNVNATFIPGMFEAEKAVLEAKLALIEAGEEAEQLGKKAQFGIDDLISAQQRELREGVPVLRTIFEKIRAAEAGETKEAGGGKTPQEEALEAAEKNLEILRIKQQLQTIDLRQQLEIAQAEQQRLNLTKQLTFDPQLRELEKLATVLKEVTFEEAKAGILAAREEMTTLRQRIEEAQGQQAGLNERLAEANAILLERQGIVDALNLQQEELQRRMTEFQIAEAGILERQAAIQEDFNALIAQASENLANVQAAARAQATIPQNIPSPASTWSSDVGNDYPIPFSTEQQQASNAAIRAAQSASASLAAADQAAGGIAALFIRLLETLGSPFAGNAGMVQFHEGGEVAPGLPAGTEVVARLQAGEHVLTGDQFSRLSHPPMISPLALPSGGSNWNWNVTINNNSAAGDAYSRFYREAFMRRLSGRWR
jgi:TP901 family phage tail tape measure protein